MSVDAAAVDRLPWLADEGASGRAKQRPGNSLPVTAAAIAAMAVGGVWIGARTIDRSALRSPQSQPSTTVSLPPPRRIVPQAHLASGPEARHAPAPEIRPAPLRELAARKPRVERAAPRKATRARPAKRLSKPSKPFVAPPAGRLVEVGAFGSADQAKRGWSTTLAANPALAHLPAKVARVRNSQGRSFYRMQVATTSQAHSEVVCQRMQKIHLSCSVVGLPWKAKVER